MFKHCQIKTSACLPLPHDVAVEGVEDALVCQLEGVVQHHHPVSLLDLPRVARTLGLRQLRLPYLHTAVIWRHRIYGNYFID